MNPSYGSRGGVGHTMALTAIANFANPFAAVLIAPVLARTLGVEGRGELTAAYMPLFLLAAIATFGVPEAATYFVASSPNASRWVLRRSTWLLLAAGIPASALLALAAHPLADGVGPVQALVMQASLILLPTVMISSLRGVASGLQIWKLVNLEKYVLASMKIFGICVPALAGTLDLQWAFIVMAASPALAGIVYLRLPFALPAADLNSARTGGFASYGVGIWTGSMAAILLSRLDQVLLNPIAGLYQLGIYAVAVSVADLTLIANNAVRDVALSASAAEYNKDRLEASARISLLIASLVGAAIAVVLPFLIPFAFGPEFSDATLACAVLIFAAITHIPGSIAGAGLSALGRPSLRSISLVVACVSNVILLAVLAPHWGAFGASVATLVGNAIASALTLISLRVVAKIRIANFFKVTRSDIALIRNVFVAFPRRAVGGQRRRNR